jgi:protein phosphatase 1 regulatory subunit 11
MSLPSRTATPSRDTGSHTLQETAPNPVLRLSAPSGVLRLRAEPEERRHIQWAEDVIDNEGMGKKSSKGTYMHLPATACQGSAVGFFCKSNR